MNHAKDLVILVLAGMVVFLLIGAPGLEKASFISPRDFLGSVEEDNEIRLLFQQVKDFSEMGAKNVTGKVKYEPTGEVFNNREEILKALPAKKERLVTLLMEREGY